MQRIYVPVYPDDPQFDAYRHIATSVDDDGVWAHFADGHSSPSVYKTEAELLHAGDICWNERVRLIFP